ncbi:MAG: AAA family ATPase [Acidobacteria bacterium]|nr:AAA family ATPase [Acidobacteriota bacterium]
MRSAASVPISIVAELPNNVQAIEQINRLRPQAALVMLNGDLPKSLQMVERLRQEVPDTAVICSSEESSSDVILQSFRSGATEFIRQPLTESEINEVFTKLEQARLRSAEETQQGRVIAVYSSKGGCGTTFVTANLAVALARLGRNRATIVDLNLQAGDQPTYLGIENTPYTIYDVVRNFDRLDDDLLNSYLTPRGKLISLLAAPTEIGRDEDVRPEHITQIITMLRAQPGYILIDPQHSLSENTIAALDLADDLVLLLTLDIPSIRSAKRALDIFRRLGYEKSRIKVVLNRYTKSPEFEIGQIEKVLEHKIETWLSNDYKAAISSINMGEPLVQSKTQSRLQAEFTKLASKLADIHVDDDPRPASRSTWFPFARK